jgi:hypothetical protein
MIALMGTGVELLEAETRLEENDSGIHQQRY